MSPSRSDRAQSPAQNAAEPPQHEIHVFGLTGGLASGKSTVAAHLRARGVPVIDADALAREVVAPGTQGLAEVAQRFGSDVLRDGALDRARLADIVFADPEQRRALEQITHPRIQRLRDERLAALADAGEPLAAYEVPLLYENRLEQELAPVIVVRAPESVQLERAMLRDGSTEARARARLAAQLPLAEKARRADYVIDNGASVSATLAAADDVLLRICERFGVDPARYFGGLSQRTSGGGDSDTLA